MVFGYLIIGSLVGVISYLVLNDRGVPLFLSVVVGSISSLLGGIISSYFNLTGSGLYGLLSSFLILFTVNVFVPEDGSIFDSE